jgi:hypothetical protein
MNAPAKYQPTLTDAEWELIIELLEHERGELPAEIRHTDTTDVRQRLQHRLELVTGLLSRLR